MNQTAKNNESTEAYRQRLADNAVNGELSSVERIEARAKLLSSFISDEWMPPAEQPKFRGRVSQLVESVVIGKNHTAMLAHRQLIDLEGQIYTPLRMAAAEEFERLRNASPDMTAKELLKALAGPEIDEFQARNTGVRQADALAALMRYSPRADILIQLVRDVGKEEYAIAFGWRPLK